MNYNSQETYSPVPIPEWLTGWEDMSWHNDAMPHSVLFFIGEQGSNVEVWVNYPDPADREFGRRFEVVYRVADDDQMSGDETLYSGDDEDEARQCAQAAELARDIISAGKLRDTVPFTDNPHLHRILGLWVLNHR